MVEDIHQPLLSQGAVHGLRDRDSGGNGRQLPGEAGKVQGRRLLDVQQAHDDGAVIHNAVLLLHPPPVGFGHLQCTGSSLGLTQGGFRNGLDMQTPRFKDQLCSMVACY